MGFVQRFTQAVENFIHIPFLISFLSNMAVDVKKIF